MGKKLQPQQEETKLASFSFFKAMIGDFKSSLVVPPSFARHIEARRSFTLRSRLSRRTWCVEVKASANSMAFQTGWGEFVEDHAIGLGEFLVFTYGDCLGFNVDVYGTDGCKKEGLERHNSMKSPSPGKTDAEKAIHPLEYPSNKCRREVLVFGRTKSGPILFGREFPGSLKRQMELEAALPFKPRNPYFVAIWRTSHASHM
ncbi:hypothetical protein Taro_025124, partial [Colocasia esculenta]|nr:hypothetical protein [Colocasia esculenta]